jgi:hypothetical protein
MLYSQKRSRIVSKVASPEYKYGDTGSRYLKYSVTYREFQSSAECNIFSANSLVVTASSTLRVSHFAGPGGLNHGRRTALTCRESRDLDHW